MTEPRASAGSLASLELRYSSREAFLADCRETLLRGGTLIRSLEPLTEGQLLQLKISFPGLIQPILLNGALEYRGEKPSAMPTAPAEKSFYVTFVTDAQWRVLLDAVPRLERGDRELLAESHRHVLVVEDNPHIAALVRYGLEAELRRLGAKTTLEIHHVETAAAALVHLDEEPVDLLLADINLPQMDGCELIAVVRQRRGGDLPILAVSAGGDEVRDAALAAGADAFLAKPLKLSSVLEVLAEFSIIQS